MLLDVLGELARDDSLLSRARGLVLDRCEQGARAAPDTQRVAQVSRPRDAPEARSEHWPRLRVLRVDAALHVADQERLCRVLGEEPYEAIRPDEAHDRPRQHRALGCARHSLHEVRPGEGRGGGQREEASDQQWHGRASAPEEASRACREDGEEAQEAHIQVEHRLQLRVVERVQVELAPPHVTEEGRVIGEHVQARKQHQDGGEARHEAHRHRKYDHLAEVPAARACTRLDVVVCDCEDAAVV
mmetsp:Transcript_22079/g.56319  ORF Transcript_22079/g.56319 Transcript_22079/m.56319 type:complete len:244 (+) Transcript_22079:144-875(+)